jgi:hypothetical protein
MNKYLKFFFILAPWLFLPSVLLAIMLIIIFPVIHILILIIIDYWIILQLVFFLTEIIE